MENTETQKLRTQIRNLKHRYNKALSDASKKQAAESYKSKLEAAERRLQVLTVRTKGRPYVRRKVSHSTSQAISQSQSQAEVGPVSCETASEIPSETVQNDCNVIEFPIKKLIEKEKDTYTEIVSISYEYSTSYSANFFHEPQKNDEPEIKIKDLIKSEINKKAVFIAAKVFKTSYSEFFKWHPKFTLNQSFTAFLCFLMASIISLLLLNDQLSYFKSHDSGGFLLDRQGWIKVDLIKAIFGELVAVVLAYLAGKNGLKTICRRFYFVVCSIVLVLTTYNVLDGCYIKYQDQQKNAKNSSESITLLNTSLLQINDRIRKLEVKISDNDKKISEKEANRKIEVDRLPGNYITEQNKLSEKYAVIITAIEQQNIINQSQINELQKDSKIIREKLEDEYKKATNLINWWQMIIIFLPVIFAVFYRSFMMVLNFFFIHQFSKIINS